MGNLCAKPDAAAQVDYQQQQNQLARKQQAMPTNTATNPPAPPMTTAPLIVTNEVSVSQHSLDTNKPLMSAAPPTAVVAAEVAVAAAEARPELEVEPEEDLGEHY